MKIVRRVVLTLSIILAVAVGFAWSYDNAGQHSNPDFDARVVSPAYPSGTPGSHPRVLMDAGHRNFHTASGRYKPFADLLKSDGYTVTTNEGAFTSEILRGVNVLVIANAMGPGAHETQPAFAPEEEAVALYS